MSSVDFSEKDVLEPALARAASIRRERGKIYGNSWVRRGLRGNNAQIQEKAMRLENLSMTGQLGTDAALDTAIDLANYALFFVALHLEGKKQ